MFQKAIFRKTSLDSALLALIKQSTSQIVVSATLSPSHIKTRINKLDQSSSMLLEKTQSVIQGSAPIYHRVLQILLGIIDGKVDPKDWITPVDSLEQLPMFEKIPKPHSLTAFTEALNAEAQKENLCQEVQRLSLKNKTSFDSKMDDEFDSQIILSTAQTFDSEVIVNTTIIEVLYDSPSPFIIVYSMSLLLKYLEQANVKLTQANAGKLLLVSVILAYKNAFDQPVQQINLYFSQISGFGVREVNGLEMKFLKEMEFRAFISQKQFLKVSDLLFL